MTQTARLDRVQNHCALPRCAPGRAARTRTVRRCTRGRQPDRGTGAWDTPRGSCRCCSPCSGRRRCRGRAPGGTGCRRGSGRWNAPARRPTGGRCRSSSAPCASRSRGSLLHTQRGAHPLACLLSHVQPLCNKHVLAATESCPHMMPTRLKLIDVRLVCRCSDSCE